ncbi:hypothetical protein MMC16_003864 [Acarospora aff. strigata]|nr:hypothetical protein [Acarospora aff. strigata]
MSKHLGAVYRSVISDIASETSFISYIGQAQILERRILQHQKPQHRELNPSLHYHVLDSSPTMHSTFVILSSTASGDLSQDCRGILNILEMFTSLLFRTLPATTLRKYLPDRIEIANPGAHLNLASPLDQGLQNQGWSLLSARDSPDPLIYNWFKRRIGIRAKQRREDQLELTRNGGLRQLQLDVSHRLRFAIGCLRMHFTVPAPSCRDYDLVPYDMVQVDFLVVNNERHPLVWAIDALDSDPGKRIAIRLSGVKPDENPFFFFLTTQGDKAAKRASSLYDFIAGVEDKVDSMHTGGSRMSFGWNHVVGRCEYCVYISYICDDLAIFHHLVLCSSLQADV